MSGAHCMVNGNFCGETETLKIIKEFQKLYEDKLKKIDELENVDASELKIQMLQEWVRDLTDQNTMLVEAVEDLEREASDRVTLLEEKLQSSQAVYKALSTSTTGPPELPKIDNVKNNSETIQVKNLEADVKNLLEVIRRVRDEGIWSIKELTFYTINSDDIIENERSKATINTRNIENNQNKSQQNLQSLKDELQQTKEDLNKKIAENITLTEQIAKMEKSAKETRDALTAEVADKHDSVRALRHEYQNLEEQCRQLDQQTHFKEDIIKEMRKELRAMRSKLNQENQCEIYVTDIALKNYSTNIWNQLKDASNNEIPSSTKELVTFLIQSEQNGVFDELKFGISATLSDIYKRDKQLIDYNSKVVSIQDNISTNLELLHSSQINLDIQKQSLEHIKNNQKTIEDRLSDIKTLLETLQAKKLNSYEKMSEDKNFFKETQMNNEKPVKEDFLLNNLANEIKLIMQNFECRSECICELEKLNNTIKTILVSTRDEFSIALKQSELYLKDNEMFQQKISINLENLNKLQSLFQFSDESQYVSSDNFQENMQAKRSVSYQIDEYDNASERNSFVDTLLEKMKNHDKQIEELDSTISKLHKELNNSQTELAALEKRNSEERMNFEYGIKKSYETKVKVQQELIKQKDKKIEELINILKGKADEKKEFEDKIKVLQSESSVPPTNSLIAQLVSELEEYREQLAESQSSIDEMRNKLEGKHQMLLNREDKIISLEKTMSSLNNMLIKSQNEIKQIKKKSTGNLTDDVEQILSITQMGIKDLHTNVIKYNSSNENEKLVQKLVELENTLLSKNAIIENLQQAVNLHQNTIQELEKQSADLQKLDTCEYLRAQIEILKKDLRIREAYICELQQNHNERNKNTAVRLQTTICSLRNSIYNYRKRLNKANAVINKLRYDKTQLVEDQDRFDNIIEEIIEQLKDIHNILEVLKSSLENDNDIKSLECKFSELKSSCTELQENRQFLEKEVIRLNEINQSNNIIINKLQKAIIEKTTEKQDVDKKIIQLENELQKALTNEKELQDTLKIRNIKINENIINLSEKDIQIKKLSLLLNKNDQQIMNIQKEISSLKDECKTLNNAYKNTIVENENLKEQIHKCYENKTEIEDNYNIMLKEFRTCRQDLDISKNIKNQLEEKNVIITKELCELQLAYQALKQDNISKMTQLLNLEMELTIINSNRFELRSESQVVINNVKCWMNEQKHIYSCLTNQIHELHELVDKLMKEKKELLQKNDYLKRKLNYIEDSPEELYENKSDSVCSLVSIANSEQITEQNHSDYIIMDETISDTVIYDD